MTDIDTSTEAVERIAAWFEAVPNAEQDLSEIAALLRQLAKERDKARSDALEEAAKVAGTGYRLSTSVDYCAGYSEGRADAHDAIRALKDKQP